MCTRPSRRYYWEFPTPGRTTGSTTGNTGPRGPIITRERTGHSWDKQSDGPHRTPHCTRIESRAHTSHPHHLIGIAGASRGPVPALPLSPFEPKGIWCLQPSLHIKESRPTASRRHSSERGRTSSCGRRLTRGGSQLKSNESARGGSQSGLASRRGGASATGAVKSRVSLNVLFLIGIHRSSSSLLHPQRGNEAPV